MIMIIILAVLALMVVKALTKSPWGMFTVVSTIPIAVLMGIWMRFSSPGGSARLAGRLRAADRRRSCSAATVAASPTWAPLFTFTGTELAWILIAYGFIAAALPVWLVLAPRDYLSTFLKIGTITALAIGIVFVAPELRMPALTRFIDGSGPVWSGALFPFLFITIACGSVSGFHALISSGTTPKMVDERNRHPLHRLWRDADGELRRHHGAHRRLGDRSRALFRHELARQRSSARPPRARPR